MCFVGDKDLGAEVIAAGLARDCPNFSGGRYKSLEKPEAMGLAYPSYCVPKKKGSGSAAPAARVIKGLDGSSGTPPEVLDRLAQLDGELGEGLEHGGGLNGCGCHFNRKTGECHCHRNYGCGCACQSPDCPKK